jgi:hypothetical protein
MTVNGATLCITFVTASDRDYDHTLHGSVTAGKVVRTTSLHDENTEVLPHRTYTSMVFSI